MIFRSGSLTIGQKSKRRSSTAVIVRHPYGVTRYRSAAEVRRLPDPLGIPTVLDRVIQQAILQVLQPIFDPEFSASSYGFRPGRSAHDAVRRVRAILDEGYTWVVDIDLAKFFDRVNHDVLMARVARKMKDKRVLRLIGLYLRAGVELDGTVQLTTHPYPIM